MNSFQYASGTVDGPTTLYGGPKLNTFYTPWIVGGGYTDGIAGSGFCGAKNFGTISGFRGYLGSTKFYNTALTDAQVSDNFDAQKTLFRNIKTIKTYSPDGISTDGIG